MIQSIDYAAIAPPLILALMAGLVLLLDAFLPRAPRNRTVLAAVTLAGVLAALGALITQAASGRTLSTFCVPPDPAHPIRSCSYVVDDLTLIFAGVVLASAVVIVLLSVTQLATVERPGSTIPAGEWYFLLLCTLTGAVTLPASRDLIMLVVALELVSLPIFALAALKRYDAKSSEAALKLFLVSVISTAVMLFGVSLLYGLTGSVHLDRIAETLAGRVPTPAGSPAGVLAVAIVLVLAGFAFKVAAVPFHFWAGDVYQGAPVPIAALLSVISKAAGFAGLILVLTIALAGQAPFWAPVVAVLAALTMTTGNLLALRQRDAVRLLAWSSVAQSGYILAPLGVQNPDAVAAATAYLAIYAAMNIGAFAVIMLVARSGDLDDHRGLAFRHPAAAISLAFFLICLAGLPPGLAGLFAKIVVFREIVDGGGAWLAVVMAVNTVIGLYYYIAWTARLFIPTPTTVPTTADTIRTGARPAAIAVAVALALSVAFSLAPQLILSAVG
ncbi:NADH-quinone oxidoreductase subunit N [Sphaerisporangium aureirubrum]|uniref:NADH-quinone oxidoreductase subunit N n=1 Tax=Sphaerisporangium aureirubrum TaxID=1544736 RepID=A0ABW1NAP2_9ACTN